jgi:hypothetical protein
VSLGAELERSRLEPGDRGFELGEVHRVRVDSQGVRVGLGGSGHVF